MKYIVDWIGQSMATSDAIDFKQLESYRGFLVYLSRTYPVMNAYLKGIHLTLDSWRPWWKEDGWKMTMTEIRLTMEEKMREGELAGWSNSKPLQKVKWVPRLVHDIKALKSFVRVAQPPKRLVRPAKGAPVEGGIWFRVIQL